MATDVAHALNCPNKHADHSDAAKRVSDQYNLHRVAGGHDAIGRVFAARLSDGKSDGELYDNKLHAVLHQRHDERFYGYLRINPASMTPCDAEGFLRMHRGAERRGLPNADRDHHAGGLQVIPRLTVEDQRAQVAQILTGSRPSNLILPTYSRS